MKRTRIAFTLIELLVVIAIIAILAAILFPVFAKAREKARQANCAMNLKQLALATMQYEQDYDEFPPCGMQFDAAVALNTCDANLVGMGWAGQIYPYVKSLNVFSCPDDLALRRQLYGVKQCCLQGPELLPTHTTRYMVTGHDRRGAISRPICRR